MPVTTPEAAPAGTAVHEVAERILAQVDHLVRLAALPGAPAPDLAEHAVRLRASVEALTGEAVRLVQEGEEGRAVRKAAPQKGGRGRRQPYGYPARCQLGTVLTQVRRCSRIPVEELSACIGLPPAQVFRILSGEQFPGWHVTERIARACGADSSVLRRVWEDERGRQESGPARR
jgi:hypothetical protein